MNEDKTRTLLKDSLLQTSAAFTDELMQKIEAQAQLYRVLKRWFVIACMACMFPIGVVGLMKLPPVIEVYEFHLPTPPLLLRIAIIIPLLIVLNRMITLRGQLKNLFSS